MHLPQSNFDQHRRKTSAGLVVSPPMSFMCTVIRVLCPAVISEDPSSSPLRISNKNFILNDYIVSKEMDFLFLANTHFPCGTLFYSSAHILQDVVPGCSFMCCELQNLFLTSIHANCCNLWPKIKVKRLWEGLPVKMYFQQSFNTNHRISRPDRLRKVVP